MVTYWNCGSLNLHGLQSGASSTLLPAKQRQPRESFSIEHLQPVYHFNIPIYVDVILVEFSSVGSELGPKISATTSFSSTYPLVDTLPLRICLLLFSSAQTYLHCIAECPFKKLTINCPRRQHFSSDFLRLTLAIRRRVALSKPVATAIRK